MSSVRTVIYSTHSIQDFTEKRAKVCLFFFADFADFAVKSFLGSRLFRLGKCG